METPILTVRVVGVMNRVTENKQKINKNKINGCINRTEEVK